MTKILIASDSFKGSLSASEVVSAISQGVNVALPSAETVLCPIADGGEGTLDILVSALNGKAISTSVHGPVHSNVPAKWGLINNKKLAIVEIAQAAGLRLVTNNNANAFNSSSWGVGELIREALDANVTRIIIGLGGSGTNDGGAGLAQALGVQFGDFTRALCGKNLCEVTSVDSSHIDRRVKEVQIDVACDVTNPLLGAKGATAVFAPQKGASTEEIQILEAGLTNLSSFFPGVDVNMPGTGAAGGIGWGLVAFCGANLLSGIELVLEVLNFEQLLSGVDLLITGEGSLDSQTVGGKAPAGVARAAAAHSIPTIALAGRCSVGKDLLAKYNIQECYSLCDYFNIDSKEAISNASELLMKLASEVVPGCVTSNYSITPEA